MISAGIIAAGEGSRFKKSGIKVHKPLIPVAGFPLIGHTLRNLEALGVGRVVVIFNETEADCVAWVGQNFPRLQFEFIVKSTKSSFESFRRVGEKLGPGRHLISTVDVFCIKEELARLLVDQKSEGILLGVTAMVDDEKPLWVQMDEGSGAITALGGPGPAKYATAGVYNVPHGIFTESVATEFSSLREYLGWLVKKGVPTRGVVLTRMVDVDLPKDVQLAEKLLREVGQ